MRSRSTFVPAVREPGPVAARAGVLAGAMAAAGGPARGVVPGRAGLASAGTAAA